MSFDHPIAKAAGLEVVVEQWRGMLPASPGPEYLLLDEIQHARDWQVWIKHQVDFGPERRIAATGSAVPLATKGQESGLGRWHTIAVPTLSFREYLELTNGPLPSEGGPESLAELGQWSEAAFSRAALSAGELIGHFHAYLLRGGFPQLALLDDVGRAQQLLSEDIIDKALRRDMTELFGVRRVAEFEQLFIYLSLHDGGLLDPQTVAGQLGVGRPTVLHYVQVLEAAHLIRRVPPIGYGKEVLRGRHKLYLADPGLAPAMLLRGIGLLSDEPRLGVAVESAVLKHLWMRYDRLGRIAYWRGPQGREVDFVVESADGLMPFEVKYSGTVQRDDLRGLAAFCASRPAAQAYIIGRTPGDIGQSELVGSRGTATRLVRIPAALACLWLSPSGA